MMWFFAVLAVLVLGAVAVVAAGRGEPMTPAGPDLTPSGLPAEGELDAEALRRVRFPLAFRGYRMAEVDALLDRLAAEREQRAAPGPAEALDPGGPDEPDAG